MAKKKNKKIIRYRKPLNINVGMIIFALIFVYMVFNVYTYMKKDKVEFYEVQDGSIVNSQNYTGIILREELVKTADRAGYINSYVWEGKRASVGTSVYSIDETGGMENFLKENSVGKEGLSDENLLDLRKKLSSFCLEYQDVSFGSVYNMKTTMESAIREYVNFNVGSDLETLMAQSGISFVQVRAEEAGVISYEIDNFESLSASEISETVFDRSSYKKTMAQKSGLIDTGTPVYKVITSDLWSVVFPMNEEDVKNFGTEKSLEVSFKGKGLSVVGEFSMITGTDAKTYGKLDFDKYMIEFASERYVDFEIQSEKKNGLKIPSTAVTSKDFFLIPLEYLTQGGDSSDTGFNKEVISDTGTSVVFVPVTIYYSTDEFYYIDMKEKDGLAAGDFIVKPDSADRYKVGTSASLQGVYNINKGYAVFKQIEVLASNDEYHIVKKNMPYGLSVYDHIVLDASVVGEGDLIY